MYSEMITIGVGIYRCYTQWHVAKFLAFDTKKELLVKSLFINWLCN